MTDFFQQQCRTSSSRRRFGLCDNEAPPSTPAYIDEGHGENWIATVVNDYEEVMNFYAIDHCVTVSPRPDGKESKRCDGVLVLNNIVAFVELKERAHKGSEWVNDAFEQLTVTINKFEDEGLPHQFVKKRGYISNSERPQARRGQAERIERFADDTDGYVLYIQATINLYSSEG